MLKELIISMRPQQWYKNLVIFVSIIFSQNLFNITLWLDAISAFIIFCMLSGSDYILNDIADIKRDMKHPKKSKRPIACGTLKKNHALLFAITIIIVALYASYLINSSFFIVSIIFFMFHNAYTFFLKHIILVDIITISMHFVIRAIAGGIAIGVFVSPWLMISTFLLALFLALGKRRHELVLLGDEAKNQRRVFEEYTTEALNQMISITISALIISYALYTFLTGNIYMMTTIPLAVYCLFRYIVLIHTKNFGGETEMIFKDKNMLISMILWLILTITILYNRQPL